MKLPIIIPLYNPEQTIKPPILSLHTTLPYHIISINHPSTHQTQHLLTQLQQKHPHIKLIHQ
ncbi:glycosyltransferase, partial [Staphylococcus epidermidis]|uniref:glycosyltransferase n=1 Tax=Staphylococcus epidermidis TaxID=1282 RepID=UPI0011A5B011